MAWNCRDAAKSHFANYMKNMLRQQKPNICYLFETRLSESSFQQIQRFMGPRWEIYKIPLMGLFGGTIITQQKSLGSISFTHIDRQVAFGTISLSNEPTQIRGAVYASTKGLERRKLEEQATSVLSPGHPLCLIGDFNYIFLAKDKMGGEVFPIDNDIKEFRAFLRQSRMVDLDFQDPKYTWCNNHLGLARIWKRIDRALVSDYKMDLYFKSIVIHLTRFVSDHSSLLLHVSNKVEKGPLPF